jgi:hypothetical protein
MDYDSAILPTKLCPTNYEADTINRTHLRAIARSAIAYEGMDDLPRNDPGPRRVLQDWLDRGCMALSDIELKPGTS